MKINRNGDSLNKCIVITGGKNFNERELREALLEKGIDNIEFSIETDTLTEEKAFLPEFLLKSVEEIKLEEEKFFKKASYQQQQRDLRFLNRRRKK